LQSSARIAALVPQAPAPAWKALQEDARYRAAKKTTEALAT
jgi:beta-N-acetylhexosaminidase